MPLPRSSGSTARRPPTGGGARQACLDLDDRVDAAPAGRRFVEAQVRERGADALCDEVALVAGELLANARLHGAPPIVVCVRGDAEALRVDVRDASPRLPIRPAASGTNMTGRGLALVAALSTRWGVDRVRRAGKAVWAEFEPAPSDRPADDDVDALLAAWADTDELTTEPRFTVVLGDVPTGFLIEAKAHIDNLVREFSLAAAAQEAGQAQVPAELARLVETVVHGFSDARDSIRRQALAAARRGEVRTRLTLHLPVSAATAGEAYLGALDEADRYARAARLLTLETPADHRLFRRWYVTAVVRQLRQLAAGAPVEQVQPFEEVLAAEVRRLAGRGPKATGE